jgi:hypothetical protein
VARLADLLALVRPVPPEWLARKSRVARAAPGPQPQEVHRMTFLEFTARRLLGPPTYDRGDGQSDWPCPRCGSRGWHTRPSSPRHRDRFSCWSCRWWGDEFDLLREFGRAGLLAEWRREHQEQQEAAVTTTPNDDGTGPGRGPDFPPRGRETGATRPNADRRSLDLAQANLLPGEHQALVTAAAAARREGVDLEALAAKCRGFDEWVEQSTARHLAECQDPVCDAVCCRAARGLPPLTREEIEAGRRKHLSGRRRR